MTQPSEEHPQPEASTPTGKSERAARIARISRRLEAFDDHALAELDRLTDEAAYADGRAPEEGAASPSTSGWSRRRLITGGVAAAAGAVTTAVGMQAAGLERTGTDRAKQRELLELYARQDDTGLDARLRSALDALSERMDGASLLASALITGITLVERGIDAVERALVPVETGLDQLAEVVDLLDERLMALRRSLGATAVPLADAVADFLQGVLARIPFDFAAQARDTLEDMRAVLAAAPRTAIAAEDGLIAPLRQLLPASDAGEGSSRAGLREQVLRPIRTELIEPARSLVTSLQDWQEAWRSEIRDSVTPALEERARLADDIARLREDLDV